MSHSEEITGGVEAAALPPSAVRVPLEPRRSHGELALETCVVLLVALLAAYFTAFTSSIWPRPSHPILLESLLYLVNDLPVILLVYYVIGRSGEPWRRFGLARPRWFLDAALVPVVLMGGMLWNDIGYAVGGGLDAVPMPPEPPPDRVLVHVIMILSVILNAFCQELITRAYLIPRLADLLGSVWASIFLSSAIFAGYHAYQGLPGVTGSFGLGLFYSGAFCLIRRIWPLALAHAAHNLIVVYT